MVMFEIESTNRWDALALAHSLHGYRWFLVEPDAEHWDVCVPVEQGSGELPIELRDAIEAWLAERDLEQTTIHAGEHTWTVGRH